MFDAVVGTPPGSGSQITPSPAAAAASMLDQNAGVLYYCSPSSNGWTPFGGSDLLKSAQLGLAAEPVSQVYSVLRNGLYEIAAYEVSTVATSGTLPAITASWTEADTGASMGPTNVVASAATSAANTVNQGTLIVNALAGTTITLAGASYASTTYNLKLRVIQS
jgi:hypothetical protein